MALAGMIQPADMVLQEGLQQWRPAREFQAIASLLTTSAEPQPTPCVPEEAEELDDTPWSLQLVGCKSCGSPVSRMADSCPSCGVFRPGYESLSESISRRIRRGKQNRSE
jgi:hypothetical protein